jgi:STIP1 family protein 1
MAETLKAQGNKAFAAGKFAAAAQAYGDGILEIGEHPPVDQLQLASLLRNNRALCSKNLGDWGAVESDARTAVAHDRFNAKGHFLLGTALLHRQAYEEGLVSLEKARYAYARSKKQSPSLLQEFDAAIASGRASWHARSQAEERRADEALQAAVLRAIVAAHAGSSGSGAGAPPAPTRLTASRRYSSAVPVVNWDDVAAGVSSTSLSDFLSAVPEEAGTDAQQARERVGAEERGLAAARLAQVMAEREEARRDRTVPDWACCGITLEPMLDPVTTPAGHSYERVALEMALKLKEEEPRTRAQLSASKVVPNLALREAIAAWLKEHPWAHPWAESLPQSKGVA